MPNAGKLNAVIMVAHPDDCIIFGFPFYANYRHFDWSICYLTYRSVDARARELTSFWERRQVPTTFLGFLDDYEYVKKGITGFDNQAANKLITDAVGDYDLILTHNADGDYGHIHHIFVHNVVKAINKPQIYFAGTDNLNYQCVCHSNEYALDEIPLHKTVVEGFQDRLIGRYFITDQAREIINV